MANLFKIFSLGCLLAFSVSGFSQNRGQVADANKITIELTINGNVSKINDMPSNGRADIFSIIGVKVASLNIYAGSGDRSINLPKGIYIIRENKSARKIAVR